MSSCVERSVYSRIGCLIMGGTNQVPLKHFVFTTGLSRVKAHKVQRTYHCIFEYVSALLTYTACEVGPSACLCSLLCGWPWDTGLGQGAMAMTSRRCEGKGFTPRRLRLSPPPRPFLQASLSPCQLGDHASAVVPADALYCDYIYCCGCVSSCAHSD